MTFRTTVGHTDGAERASVPTTFRLTRPELGVLLAAHPMRGRPATPRISSLEEHVRAVLYDRGMSATRRPAPATPGDPAPAPDERARDWAAVQLARLWPAPLADLF